MLFSFNFAFFVFTLRLERVEPVWIPIESRLKILEGVRGDEGMISFQQGGAERNVGYMGLGWALGGCSDCTRRQRGDDGWRCRPARGPRGGQRLHFLLGLLVGCLMVGERRVSETEEVGKSVRIMRGMKEG